MKARDLRTVNSVRHIPRRCECTWMPDCSTRPATWRLTEGARDCPVHVPAAAAPATWLVSDEGMAWAQQRDVGSIPLLPRKLAEWACTGMDAAHDPCGAAPVAAGRRGA